MKIFDKVCAYLQIKDRDHRTLFWSAYVLVCQQRRELSSHRACVSLWIAALCPFRGFLLSRRNFLGLLDLLARQACLRMGRMDLGMQKCHARLNAFPWMVSLAASTGTLLGQGPTPQIVRVNVKNLLVTLCWGPGCL